MIAARATLVFATMIVGSLHIVHAATIIATPSDVVAKISTLTPGDVLELRADAGSYTGGLPLYNLNGTVSQPITVRGPTSGARPIIEGTMGTNVIRIRSSSYLILQNLEVNGLGREGDGIKADGGTCPHDIVIENIYIHDLEQNQQVVGISSNGCSGVSWNWTIRGNRIERVGTGMYLGNSDGNQQFLAGVIEYNTILETIGYNIEIKHQNARPNVAGMPTGDSRTIIRHNVFSKSAATSSTGGLARPNLLVGHWPKTGVGQNDRYEIYGNFFFQNPVESLFQGEGNIYFYNNVLYNSLGTALRIQPHNDAPKDVHLFNNTIVASGTGISISGGASGFVQEAFGNAVFAGSPLSGGTNRDNTTGTFAQAATFLNETSAAIATLDLFPKAALTGSTINYTSVTAPTGSTLGAGTSWNIDFNGATQPGNVRGAYVGAGTNPGWKLALGTKPGPSAPTPGAPAVTLNATPATVALNGVAQLAWTSDATSCVASGNWSGAKATQGSEQVGPLSANASYTLTCTNASGSTPRTATVSVATPPTVTLSSSATSVLAGERATLTWSSTNANSCAAGGAWAGNKSTSGTEQSAALMISSAFTLTCTGPGGDSLSPGAVSVAVTSGIPPQPTTPPVTPTTSAGSGGGGTTPLTLALLIAISASRAVIRRDAPSLT